MVPSRHRVRVVVADDHPVYRNGLADAVAQRSELELVAACSHGDEALEAILRLRPDAALLDVRMPVRDGIAVLDALTAARCPTRVVFLSAFEDGALVHAALTAGAAGYLSKETDRDEICDALVRAMDGHLVVSATLPAALVGHLRTQHEPAPKFGAREREVMRLTAQGLSRPEIAERLGIGSTTVKTYMKRVYAKLDVTDRAAMVAEAMRRGLVT
jgi:two-component system, NarL family, nitrate/nitrite response regulator NarL